MKHLILAVSLVAPLPAFAQDTAPPDTEIEEGFSLMEEGARLLFRGLMSEMEPTIDDFAAMAEEIEPALELLATEMGPALIELLQAIDSARYYERPEILPNGDIIIRRSPDAPDYDPTDDAEVIDL